MGRKPHLPSLVAESNRRSALSQYTIDKDILIGRSVDTAAGSPKASFGSLLSQSSFRDKIVYLVGDFRAVGRL